MAQPHEITLGIPHGPYLARADQAALDHFYDTADRLAAAGYQVKEIDAMAHFEDIYHHHIVVNEKDAADYHEQFSDYFHLYHPKTMELVQDGRKHSRRALAEGREVKRQTRRYLHQLMDQHRLDAWITPAATGTAPQGYTRTGDPVMQLPWTNAGMPTLNLPSGLAKNGLPYGLQLAARANEDELLFMIGRGVEQLLEL